MAWYLIDKTDNSVLSDTTDDLNLLNKYACVYKCQGRSFTFV